MIEQTSTLLERLKICWHALTKKNYVFFGIGKNPIVWGENGKANGTNRKDLACYSCITYDYKFNTDNGESNLHDFVWGVIEDFAKDAQKGKY